MVVLVCSGDGVSIVVGSAVDVVAAVVGCVVVVTYCYCWLWWCRC